MILRFRKEPTATYTDITNLLDMEADLEVTDEAEDDAGTRVVGDINLTLNDMEGAASALFEGMRAEDKFWVELVNDDGRRKFKGRVYNSSIDRDLEEHKISLNAFSSDRVMWDIFKGMRPFFEPPINVFTGLPETELSLERLFAYQIDPFYDQFSILFSARDFGVFATRTIFSDPDGVASYFRLDPSTTFKDVILAILTQWNAEMWIDAETDTLMVRHRKEQLSDTAHDLDALLLRKESGMRLKYIDDEKYDYVFALARTTTAYPPELIGVSWTLYTSGLNSLGLDPGHYTYVLTAIFNSVEYQQSDPLELTLTGPNDQSTRARVDLRIPPAIAGTTTRRLWRKSDADPVFRLVNWWDHNNLHDTYDIRRTLGGQEVLATKSFYAVGAWYGYSDTEGWLQPIYDTEGGGNRPDGRVLDSVPDLSFVDETGNSLPDDPLYLFYFFNQAITTEMVMEDWIDVMRTRRSFECTVNGTDYRFGDTFVTPQGIVPNDFTASDRLIVRRAVANHNPKAQKTRVKLLTV